MTPGSPVTLNTPTNPKLHQRPGTIAEVTDYGYVVHTTAAATGRFRALPDEVIPAVAERNGAHKVKQAKESGFTGDICINCQSIQMKRNGSCLMCLNCGQTTGCS